MEIQPIAHFESPFSTKFGIPRQSGLVPDLTGRIVFEPEYRQMDAVRGIDGFDYLWLVWEFSANRDAEKSLTVRPPASPACAWSACRRKTDAGHACWSPVPT